MALLTLSGELRFPVIDQMLYLSAFGDMGNAWENISEVSLTDLYPALVSASGWMFRCSPSGFDLGYGFKSLTDYGHFGSKPNGWKFGFQLGKDINSPITSPYHPGRHFVPGHPSSLSGSEREEGPG